MPYETFGGVDSVVRLQRIKHKIQLLGQIWRWLLFVNRAVLFLTALARPLSIYTSCSRSSWAIFICMSLTYFSKPKLEMLVHMLCQMQHNVSEWIPHELYLSYSTEACTRNMQNSAAALCWCRLLLLSQRQMSRSFSGIMAAKSTSTWLQVINRDSSFKSRAPWAHVRILFACYFLCSCNSV